MYQIGLFSKMNRITTKTLRHYDDIGLLKPAFVDELTGYRFYTSEQLPTLNRIIALKQMGLSLKDILTVIDEKSAVEVFLRLKEQELKQHIREDEIKLSHVKNYLKRMKGEFLMNYNPVIKSLPECIVASMRFNADSYEDYFKTIPPMGKEMGRLGAICAEPAYCFNIYHDGEYKSSDMDVEVCEAVVDYCDDSDIVKFKKIDQVNEALCVLHKGPYSDLASAYDFAFQWLNDNGYEIVGPPRESYIDGIWNKDSDNDWLTELQIPMIKSK